MQARTVTRELVEDSPVSIDALVPKPPETWVVRGPRGGHYLAVGQRERLVGETGDDYIMNTLTVMDRSAGSRYLRPERARRLVMSR